jgi:hypothetical protein
VDEGGDLVIVGAHWPKPAKRAPRKPAAKKKGAGGAAKKRSRR